MFDLHTHTVFSDGTTTPEENAALAAAAGLRGFAVTDHDTVAGWSAAEAACGRLGIQFVPGIELSAEVDGRSVHLLGYWVDAAHDGLAAECRRLRGERERRALAVLSRLDELGVPVSEGHVRAIAGAAPIGRPHIAAAMVAAAVVPDLQAAFDEYLHDGGPAYEPKRAIRPEAAVQLIHAAGGAAVLAHPGAPERGEPEGLPLALVDRLVAAGLAGLEVDHPGHDGPTVERLGRFAAARDLLVTGSSDFHGKRKDVKIGACTTAPVVLEALRERRGQARRPVSMSTKEEPPW